MGRTGVGKSSLINYLAGDYLAEAGISSGGITHGIHKYPINLNGQECVVADTEGLETNTSASDYWLKLMQKELLDTDRNKPISQWYHIVVYCIGANGGRVEDIELKMLEQLDEAGYGIIIALTKADVATDEDLMLLQDVIENHFDNKASFQFVPVCSKKTRSGNLEGKEELCSAIIDAWGESILNRLPNFVYSSVDSFWDWVNETDNWINSQGIGVGLFTKTKDDVLNELNAKVKNKIRQMQRDIDTKKRQSFNEIGSVYRMLNTVLDTKTFTNIDTSFAKKIDRLESNFVFDSRAGRNSMLAIGGGGLLLAAPYLAPFIGMGALVISLWDRQRQREETSEAFNKQAKDIYRAFIEQHNVFLYSLAATLGYMYGFIRLGICYLKGRGVEQNYDKFIECLNEIIAFSNEHNSYRDSIAEYYIGYAFSMSNDKENADYWFRRSADHGNENSMRILSGTDVEYIESQNDAEYEKRWE